MLTKNHLLTKNRFDLKSECKHSVRIELSSGDTDYSGEPEDEFLHDAEDDDGSLEMENYLIHFESSEDVVEQNSVAQHETIGERREFYDANSINAQYLMKSDRILKYESRRKLI